MSKDKLIELSNRHEKKSTWLKGALERKENRKWLDYSSQIALRILSKLEESKLSQAKLAKILNVSDQQVSKIVKGHENLTLETISKLSDALGIDLISFPEYNYSYTEHINYEIPWTQFEALVPNEFFQNTFIDVRNNLSPWSVYEWKKIINTPLENSVESVEKETEDPSIKYLKRA